MQPINYSKKNIQDFYAKRNQVMGFRSEKDKIIISVLMVVLVILLVAFKK